MEASNVMVDRVISVRPNDTVARIGRVDPEATVTIMESLVDIRRGVYRILALLEEDDDEEEEDAPEDDS